MSKKIKSIKKDGLININISGQFYTRIHNLLLSLATEKNKKEFVEIVHHLKTGEPRNVYEEHVLTILVLMYDLEKAAQAQGLVIETEVESPKKEDLS